MIPIYAELVYPTKRRANKVVGRAIMIDFFFYFTICMAGYWSMLDQTPVIVLQRKSKESNSKDIAGVLGVVGVVGSILVAFPCCYNPTRAQMCNLIFGKEEFSKKTNVIMTSIFVGITWFVAFIFPKVNQIMSILGGICAVTLDYGIPTFCFVRLSKKAWTAWPNLSRILFFGFLNISGFIGTGVTVYEIFSHCTRMPHPGEAECPKDDSNVSTTERL